MTARPFKILRGRDRQKEAGPRVNNRLYLLPRMGQLGWVSPGVVLLELLNCSFFSYLHIT